MHFDGDLGIAEGLYEICFLKFFYDFWNQMSRRSPQTDSWLLRRKDINFDIILAFLIRIYEWKISRDHQFSDFLSIQDLYFAFEFGKPFTLIYIILRCANALLSYFLRRLVPRTLSFPFSSTNKLRSQFISPLMLFAICLINSKDVPFRFGNKHCQT